MKLFMNEKLLNLLLQADLFSCVKSEILEKQLSDETTSFAHYKSGELIYSGECFKEAIGVVVSGSAKVKKKNSDVIVGKLHNGDIFGCQSLFLGGDFFTNEIFAQNETDILYISKAAVISLMQLEPGFSLEYIRYLSGRIFYLNQKIGSFTGGTAESRLAGYLLACFGDYKTFSFDMPLSQLAVYLDIGRASLYRAFDSIIAAGAIEKEGKMVRLLNKDVLASFVK